MGLPTLFFPTCGAELDSLLKCMWSGLGGGRKPGLWIPVEVESQTGSFLEEMALAVQL